MLMAGAVGFEPTTSGVKDRCSSVKLYAKMVEASSIDLEDSFLAKKTRWATACPQTFGVDGRSLIPQGHLAYYAKRQVGYSHLDVHTSHLQKIWHAPRDSNPDLTGSKPAALNPLSYKRMAESGVIETQSFRVTWLSKPVRSLTDSLSKMQIFVGGRHSRLSPKHYPQLSAAPSRHKELIDINGHKTVY